MSVQRRHLNVQMLDGKRCYAFVGTFSIEAVRAALHAGLDAWVDEELAPAIDSPSQLQYAVPQPRIEVRG